MRGTGITGGEVVIPSKAMLGELWFDGADVGIRSCQCVLGSGVSGVDLFVPYVWNFT
jgi:hypothetical protein